MRQTAPPADWGDTPINWDRLTEDEAEEAGAYDDVIDVGPEPVHALDGAPAEDPEWVALLLASA